MNTFRDHLRGRFAVLGVVVLVVLGGLAAQLWSMQILNGATFVAAANSNRIRQVSLPAVRGRVLDDKGRPLVTNRPVMVVNALATVAQDTTLVARLSQVIDVPVPEIQKRLASYKVQPLAPRTLRVDVPMTTAAYIVEHAPDFPGITIGDSAGRPYPYGELAAHVLGYTGEISEQQLASTATSGTTPSDIVGKAGVEAYYDSVLEGEKGYETLEVDNMGHVRSVLDQGAPP